jgi:hypothetical protein
MNGRNTIRINKMKIEKKQIVLFVVLVTWPLVPFLVAEMFSAGTATAFVKSVIALGLGVFV